VIPDRPAPRVEGARPSLCAGLAVGSAGRHGSLHPAALRN